MALSQDDLQAIAAIMDAKLDPVKMEIAGMKSEISGMKSEIAGTKSEIAGMKSEIAGTKSEITEMKSEITGMKSEIAGMKSEITGIKAELAKKADKSDIEYLKYQIRKSERLILDEVERVHEILDRHIKDTSRHTA
ncbi:hypothetical protein [Diplocloster modestus]|uniref:hypothetical protein n=1 Tax=Diplocloster modestus TaxID=2850322 RepID=UPI00130DD918|nr:hypothetical protein [Diplocloster modestus]